MLEAATTCVESERWSRFAAKVSCVIKEAEPPVSAVTDRRCQRQALATRSSKLESQLNVRCT
jgi:hypothetical protein